MDEEKKITGTLEELLKLGFSLLSANQQAEAAGIFQQLLNQFPKEPNSLYGLGSIAYQQQRWIEAKTYLGEVLTVLPEHVASLELLAAMALQEQRWPEAEGFLQKRLAAEPDNPVAYYNLGYGYQQQGLLSQAEHYYQEALARNMNYPECLLNLAVLYRTQQAWAKAEALFDSALKINPTYVRALMNLGELYEMRSMWVAAQQRYQQALKLEPKNPDILSSLGVLFHKQGHWDKAKKYYLEAMQQNPNHILANYNLSLLLLLQADFSQGWRHYAARKHLLSLALRPSARLREWDGVASLTQQKIYLLPEQGYGDYLMCVRFAKYLQAKGAEVVAVHDAALRPLLQTCKALAEVIDPPTFAAREQGFQVLIADLPGMLQIDAHSIPHEVPYLSVPAGKENVAGSQLARCQGLKIGFCFAGARHFKGDAARSMPLTEFAPLLAFNKVNWVNLTAQQDGLLGDAYPQVLDVSEQIKDFGDTAGVLAQLDLVITVDTAIAHVAGALNVPCWVMLPKVPDWRWQLNRYDSPWYPSITLFRQKRLGNWNDVVHAVMKALKKYHAEAK